MFTTDGVKALVYHLAFLVTPLTGCAQRSEKPIPCTEHTNRNEWFSLCIPMGWSFADTSYHYMGRIDVFGLARNRAATGTTPDISHEYMHLGPERRTWEAELAHGVPPGGVIVMFSHFHGGPYVECNFSRDVLGESLADLVDTLRMSFSQAEPFRLHFGKWGDNWQITVLAQSVTPADSLAIRDLLRSITFKSVPVVSQGQAAQLAYRALPVEIREVVEKPNSAGLMVGVTKRDGDFQVHFQSCEACCGCDISLPPELEWHYRVHINGVVETASR